MPSKKGAAAGDWPPAKTSPLATYSEAIYADAYAGRVPAEVPVFMTSGTLKDPGGDHTAPPGHSTLELMTIAPAEHDAWGVGEGPVAGERYSRAPSYLAVKEKLAPPACA